MFGIKAVEYVTTRIRLSGELEEKRWEEISTILLIKVLEVKIEVGNRSQSGLA